MVQPWYCNRQQSTALEIYEQVGHVRLRPKLCLPFFCMPSFPGLQEGIWVPGNEAASNYITSALAAVQTNQMTQQQVNLLQTPLLLVLDCWRHTSLSTESTVTVRPTKQVGSNIYKLTMFTGTCSNLCAIFWTSQYMTLFNFLVNSSHSCIWSNETEAPWMGYLSISVLWYPYIHPRKERHCESKVSPQFQL